MLSLKENEKLLIDMMADTAYEWLERTWSKYSVLIGMHGGSMKADKRWERVDTLPGCRKHFYALIIVAKLNFSDA